MWSFQTKWNLFGLVLISFYLWFSLKWNSREKKTQIFWNNFSDILLNLNLIYSKITSEFDFLRKKDSFEFDNPQSWATKWITINNRQNMNKLSKYNGIRNESKWKSIFYETHLDITNAIRFYVKIDENIQCDSMIWNQFCLPTRWLHDWALYHISIEAYACRLWVLRIFFSRSFFLRYQL